MKAGNDLLMPGTPKQTAAIIAAVKDGTLDEKVLNENCERILNLVFHSPAFKKYKFSDRPDLKKDARISRSTAEEGMVLLKNENNTLPYTKSTHTIALFGINGYGLLAGGSGSGDVNKAYTVSLMQGLSSAGYSLDAAIKNGYTNYLSGEHTKHPKKSFFEEFKNPTPPVREYLADSNLINKKAFETDVAIIAIGRNAEDQGTGN